MEDILNKKLSDALTELVAAQEEIIELKKEKLLLQKQLQEMVNELVEETTTPEEECPCGGDCGCNGDDKIETETP